MKFAASECKIVGYKWCLPEALSSIHAGPFRLMCGGVTSPTRSWCADSDPDARGDDAWSGGFLVGN